MDGEAGWGTAPNNGGDSVLLHGDTWGMNPSLRPCRLKFTSLKKVSRRLRIHFFQGRHSSTNMPRRTLKASQRCNGSVRKSIKMTSSHASYTPQRNSRTDSHEARTSKNISKPYHCGLNRPSMNARMSCILSHQPVSDSISLPRPTIG
jgi:hypothetical protein